jgi:hypothetical protein
MPADRRFPSRREREERPHPYQPARQSGEERPHPHQPARQSWEERPHPYQPARQSGPPGRSGEGLSFTTSFRLRDGDREVEVSGSTGFVRQVLDELPVLIARLRSETAPTPASIRMPSPPPAQPVLEPPGGPLREPATRVAAEPESDDRKPLAAGNGRGARSLEERVLATLRGAAHPLPVAEIRGRLGSDVSGQQVRRVLERAAGQVVATADRPIRYRLR